MSTDASAQAPSDLTVVTEELPGSEVGLTVEVPQLTVDAAYERVLGRLARRAKIEGFRPGKAPRALVEARVGPDALREEVIDALVPEVLTQVLTERNLEPIAQPRVSQVELERGRPGRFSATVPVMPEVKLPDLEKLVVERPASEVTEEMVDRRLEALRDALAELEPVEREAREGDIVVADIEVDVDGRRLESQSRKAAELDVREGFLIPEIRGAVVGKRPGETAEAQVTLPDDFSDQEAAGKAASFHVTVQGVKEKHVPELTDELAGQLSDGKHSTADALRTQVRSDLEQQAVEMDRLAFEQAVLKAVVDSSEVEVPEALTHAQVHRQLDDLEARLSRSGIRLETFLAYQNLDREAWERQTWPEAESRLKVELVLDEVARTRGIEPTDAEVDEYIETESARDDELKNRVELLKQSASTRRYFRNRLQRMRTLDHLVESVGKGSSLGG